MLCTYLNQTEMAEVSLILLKFSDIIRSRTMFTRTQQVGCVDWTDGEVRPTTPVL